MGPKIANHPNVFVLDHPLIQHKLTILRDEDTGAKEFRELVKELSLLITFEATRNFHLAETTVKTPVAETTSYVLVGKKVAVIPILRAGLGMVEAVLELIPAAKVGHIGLYRDPETLAPVEYYCKLPEDIGERDILIVDPMLATGGSASAAVKFLRGKGAREINLICLIAAPEGIEEVVNSCENVKVYVAAIDSHLNEHGYIVPGLGDAGDRMFGTK
ncbi:MAG: uracil phosphoribosyltransferase [Actinobacteria bacterium]|nr:uracil phosphoribosyltransferase [Actinomycetota bacterium]